MKRKLVRLRQSSQVIFFSLFVYALWSAAYPFRGLIAPELVFKIDPLLVFLVSASERVLIPGIGFAILMVFLTLILGRFFCGWICPLGTMSDWVGALAPKRKDLTDSANRSLRNLKYGILGGVFILALFGIQAAWVLDPVVIAARFISLNIIPALTWALDGLLVWTIRTFHLYDGGFYDFYGAIKSNVLGVKTYYFSNTGIIFAFCALILSAGFFLPRFWCRSICPLGALYALFSKPAFLERAIGDCTGCGICRKKCRMGAIDDRLDYVKAECVLCMDCVYDCPKGETRFQWKWISHGHPPRPSTGSLTRGQFLLLVLSSLPLFGFRRPEARSSFPTDHSIALIRPPAALREPDFVDRCIRCGNCMRVCVTNGLQPVMLESGWAGIWTPRLVPEIGYCEYQCLLCGNVCPTGAIPKLALEKKKEVKLGLAVVDRTRCLPWAEQKECLVCEEHCPVSRKAIKRERQIFSGGSVEKPVVDADLCIGCGICEYVCPVRPARAIRITALGADRF